MKTYRIELDDKLAAAIETLAERDRRDPWDYIEHQLHLLVFGCITPATDAEVAAFMAKRGPKVGRVNLKAVVRSQIYERDSGVCRHCGGQIQFADPWHIDHLIPLAKGGTNDPANLALSCVRCNLEKSTKVPA